MQQLAGRTAVVTGAASGIGRALAERFAAAGMQVVLADIDAAQLGAAEQALREQGASTLAVPTDVADAGSVEALAAAATDRFGDVHVLCNNAGVGTVPRMVHEIRLEDWEWVLGVNLWGVIHGVRAFVPGMLAHGEEGHIVNTSSMTGLLNLGGVTAPYPVTKYGVVALSESLRHELRISGSPIGVSVLCPGEVATNISETSIRNRPEAYGGPVDVPAEADFPLVRAQLLAYLRTRGTDPPGTDHAPLPLPQLAERQARAFADRALEPSDVAEQVERAIAERRFWVLTDPSYLPIVSRRAEEIVNQSNPEHHLLPG